MLLTLLRRKLYRDIRQPSARPGFENTLHERHMHIQTGSHANTTGTGWRSNITTAVSGAKLEIVMSIRHYNNKKKKHNIKDTNLW